MPRRAGFIALVVACVLFSGLAVAGAVLAVYLVWMGAYPPAGEGSLGHVGMVVAGVVAGFLSLVLALLGLYTGLRARAARQRDDQSGAGSLPR